MIGRVIMCMCMLLVLVMPAQAYTVNQPRMIVHRSIHLVQLKWTVGSMKRVTVMKLTQAQQGYASCSDVDWGDYIRITRGAKYCVDVYAQWVSGDVTIQDTHWQAGDVYYILQYEYTSHNAPYGPFIP